MQTRTTDDAGLHFRWQERGDGLPVVLLHGIPTSPALWRHVAPRLSGCRVLAWELVGYGASLGAGEGRDLAVARQADYLVRWMDAVGLDRAVLVGHDLGGGVAQVAAVRHPARVCGLALTNTIAYDNWPVPSVEALRVLGPLLARCPAAVLYPVFGLLMLRGHDDLGAARAGLRTHLAPYLAQPGGAAAFVRQIEALDVRDTLSVAADLPALGLPARLVWGAADPFLPVSYGERLAEALGAPLDRIEGGRHFVPEDHPDRVAATIQAVVDEVGRG